MIGRYGDETNSTRYRDVLELIAMRLYVEHTIPEKRRNGEKVHTSDVKSWRDAWVNNEGQPIDISTHRIGTRDIVRILESSGIDPESVHGGNLETFANNFAKETAKMYDDNVKNGLYIHTVSDPEIREHILDRNDASLKKAIFTHKGKSLRELNEGEKVELYDKDGKNLVYEGYVRGLETTRKGFNQAEVVNTMNTGRTTPIIESEASDALIEADERFLGWNGGEIDEIEYRGLKDVLGAYFTPSDIQTISRNIDADKFFDGSYVNNSLVLLRHLRSNGHEFSAREYNVKRNQIEVSMQSDSRTRIRIFDPERDGAYIGRVYNTHNTYYYTPAGRRKLEVSPEDSLALLDYALGHNTGTVIKSKGTASSALYLEGMGEGKQVRVSPNEEVYRSLIFKDKEDAENYIKEAIESASQYVNKEFKLEELQELIDKGLDNQNLTSPEFELELQDFVSHEDSIEDVQREAVRYAFHSDDNGLEFTREKRDSLVGSFEDGFNPSVVLDYMEYTEKGNSREALMSAIKIAGYDLDKLKGNNFAVDSIKERLVEFDPESAKSIDEIENPLLRQALTTVNDTLIAGNIVGEAEGTEPSVKIDKNGVIRWEGHRKTGAKKGGFDNIYQKVSGEIGQIFAPDEYGIIQTNFQGERNYGFVPGYAGYFAFDNDNDGDRMKRFRVKGYEQHLTERLRATVNHQIVRPFDRDLNDIPTTLDASSLNSLYHKDVYGRRIEPDFMETSLLPDDVKVAILNTLSKRVRLDSQYADHATTMAETRAESEMGIQDSSAYDYYEVAGGKNIRVLHEDMKNYVDMTMTGEGGTQGLVLYLTEGAEVNLDGTVIPSEGVLNEKGEIVPDSATLMKHEYFKHQEYNAWNRNQMSANQLLTGLRVSEANTALITFGGRTLEDGFVISKEFAEKNQVFGEKTNMVSYTVLDKLLRDVANGEIELTDNHIESHNMRWSREVIEKGVELYKATNSNELSKEEFDEKFGELNDFINEYAKYRPLQRGDKLSDFGGNKGVIGTIVDRNMSPEDAKKLDLEKEVEFMKLNPELEVISSPYAMLSRLNAGVIHELMDGETKDLINPNGDIHKHAMGKLNILVTDMLVDKKTKAYTEADIAEGKGRKASPLWACAIQSHGASGIMNEVYGKNDKAWETLREYTIAIGLDIGPDGTVYEKYTPHKGEVRNHFEYDSSVSDVDFINSIKDKGGFLNLPFDVEFATGEPTNTIPVLSASLRQSTELDDGTMRRDDFTNHYSNIYKNIGIYLDSKDPKEKREARGKVQGAFNRIQHTIIDRQINGKHNGKHSYLRDNIMSKRIQSSATGVAIPDVSRKIGEVGMDSDMTRALNAKNGTLICMHRDPVLRDGSVRAMRVVEDETSHGLAFSPFVAKSFDGDFDGDTYGAMRFYTKEANKDLYEKLQHHSNLVDEGGSENRPYLLNGEDTVSALAKAKEAGDGLALSYYNDFLKNYESDDVRLQKKAVRDYEKYIEHGVRKYGFGSAFVNLENDKTVFNSFKEMVDSGAKGSEKNLENLMKYYNGEKISKDDKDIQYATGVKTDVTGVAGAYTQRLIVMGRNFNATAPLETTYGITQGVLQIKHDADMARDTNSKISKNLYNIFNGKHPENNKVFLTPSTFTKEYVGLMNDLGIDINENHVKAVAGIMSDNGRMMPLKEAMDAKGSLSDVVAYGGGFQALVKGAKNNESLLDGELSREFAPMSMREADENTKIAKKDTQRSIEISKNLESSSKDISGKDDLDGEQLSMFDTGPVL